MTSKRPLKILQVASIEGTVDSLLYRLCERLQREGFEVHAACAPDPAGRRIPESIRMMPIPFSRKILTLRHLPALVELYRLFRREQYSIVHLHTPIASMLGRIAAWAAHAPFVIYTAHGFPFHEGMRPAIYRLTLWFERFFCRRAADLIFLQSQEDLSTARRERITDRHERPPLWIGNGIDLSLFHPGSEPAVRKEFGFDADAPILAFIGRLAREKGIPELLEAIRRVRQSVPNLNALLIGTHNTEHDGQIFFDEMNAQIAELGLRDVVRLTGLREDVDRLLRASTLLVLPSHREGMPRSIIEGMATGLPVVATDIRGCREEVVDGETGLLVPIASPDQLAEAILKILGNPTCAREMGAAGRRRVEELFDEESVFERQLRAIREELDRNGTPQVMA